MFERGPGEAPGARPKEGQTLKVQLKWIQSRRKGLLYAAGGVIVVVLIAVVTLARGGVPAFGQSFAIGVVDMQRALDTHPRKAASERALQEFFQAKQRGVA